MLEEKKPDSEDSVVVLVGAGFEPIYKQILNTYRDIIRVGLAQRGDVDLFCDVCELPIVDGSLDLIFSSSILEHVYDSERAVKEMFRVVKPGGYVYAEIPFMRAYHMIPIDYQRYTISGIEELFARHGFRTIEKGICSGPFTAAVLFFTDFCRSFFSFNKHLRKIFVGLLFIVLHPVKYLDRFFEDSKWAEVNACNFYYLGKKNSANKR
jgi:SAM-dependent methyltransferase